MMKFEKKVLQFLICLLCLGLIASVVPLSSSCPNGTYYDGRYYRPSQNYCTDCPQGYYCPGDGNHSPCPKGTYNPNINATYCMPCEQKLGYQCASDGMTKPMECPVGYYCPNITTLIKCPAGQYAPN